MGEFAYSARGKVCDFAFLTSSGGKFYEFFMTIALAIPPLIQAYYRIIGLIRYLCIRDMQGSLDTSIAVYK